MIGNHIYIVLFYLICEFILYQKQLHATSDVTHSILLYQDLQEKQSTNTEDFCIIYTSNNCWGTIIV